MPANPLQAHPYWRQLIIVAIAVPALAVAAVLAFAWPAARTQPRDLPVGLVAGSSTAQVSAALDHAAPGGFDLRVYPDTGAARRAIHDRDIYGAIASRNGTLTVYTASAASTVVAQLLTTTGDKLAHTSPAHPESVTVVDVVPLAAGDSRGSILTSTLLPLILGSILVGAVVGLLLAGRRFGERVLALLAVSAVLAVGVLLIAQGFLGALPHEPVATWAALFLSVFTVASAVAGTVSLVGPLGIALLSPLLIFLGNAFSGSTSAPQMLPEGVRVIGQLLPPGAALNLVRGTAYFGGSAIAEPLVVLIVWLVLGLGALGAGHYRAARRASGAHEQAEQRAVVDLDRPRHAPAVAS